MQASGGRAARSPQAAPLYLLASAASQHASLVSTRFHLAEESGLSCPRPCELTQQECVVPGAEPGLGGG